MAREMQGLPLLQKKTDATIEVHPAPEPQARVLCTVRQEG